MKKRLGAQSRCAVASAAVWALALGLSGCFVAQIVPTAQEHGISLRAGDLKNSGIAFLTPSSSTGQEEEKQA
ncbi:MAG TPA: hypothetical protein VFY80_05765, partial [Burkholderiales bacterium]|nr:hypothetical protein [Burkholderiales bacterium]